ncbi:MAG TPA: glycine cleavage system protein GcvH [candidate division Zixibacteria bacterium]|nr:glycine cleavage system protein GcvH [candidate division Zixibacteria bacterium]
MNVPGELKYTKEHEWVKVDGKTAIVGITDFAQGELGDIVFIELPNVGESFGQMKPFGTIEAVKAVSDMFAPLGGKVLEVNTALDDDPMIINRDPYGDGWILKLELSDSNELDDLLDAKEYQGLIG